MLLKFSSAWQGMMVHACNPKYLGGGDQEDWIKVTETPSVQQISWEWWFISVIPAT
jgi:hypothetical protein